MGDHLAAKRTVQAIAKVELKRNQLFFYRHSFQPIYPFLSLPIKNVYAVHILPGGFENYIPTIFQLHDGKKYTRHVLVWPYKYKDMNWEMETQDQIDSMIELLMNTKSKSNTSIQIPPLV